MPRLLVGLCLMLGCGGHEAKPPVPERPVARVHVPAKPRVVPGVTTAPHGSFIRELAVTDAGDAAVSVDEDDAVRLWPSLDGKHEPVVLSASSVARVAIATVKGGVAVAVLDRAGGITIWQRDREGRPFGVASVAPEPGFDELRAFGEGFLAIGRDQRIARIDGGGQVTGYLGAPEGEELGNLVVRGSQALATIGSHDRVETLRRISLDPKLAWGAPLRLPEPVESVAISPNGKHLAAITAKDRKALLIDVGDKLTVHARGVVPPEKLDPFDAPRPGETGFARLGFLDEDTVVAMPANVVLSWRDGDPWSHPGSIGTKLGGVVANNRAVSADGGSLVIATPAWTRYLGYKSRGADSPLASMPTRLEFLSDSSLVQLDDQLQTIRTFPLDNLFQNFAVPLDDKHVIYGVNVDGHYRFHLRDLEMAKDSAADLGTFVANAYPYYNASSHVIAIKDVQVTYRYRVDLATLTVKPLSSLATPFVGTLSLLDPKAAHDAIAVVVEPDESRTGVSITTFYDDKPDGTLVRPRESVHAAGELIGVDRSGAAHILEGNEWVTRYRAGKAAGSYRLDRQLGRRVRELGPNGEVIAYDLQSLYVFDPTGHERWHVAAWKIDQVEMSADGLTLVANTDGGMVAYDAKTGEPIARACGWDFGLYDDALPPPEGAPSVCAD